MSYGLPVNKFRKNEDNLRDLNDDRKQEILKELQDEMDKLKVKYMLEQKDKNIEKISNIKSLDSMTNRAKEYGKDEELEEIGCQEDEAHFDAKNEKLEREENRIRRDNFNRRNYYDNDEGEEQNNDLNEEYYPEQEEPFHDNYEEDYNYQHNQDDYLPPNEMDSNSGNNINNHHFPQNNYTKIESIRDLQSSQRSNATHLNPNKSSLNKSHFLNQGTNSHNVSNYELFDKAKENLLKIKNELDDMDQYDYRNRIAGNSSMKQHSNNQSNLEQNQNYSQSQNIKEDSNIYKQRERNEYDVDE